MTLSESLLTRLLRRFFRVADALLNLSFYLLRGALDLLRRTSSNLADFLLHLASDVFGGAFYLILVHLVLQ